MEKIFTMKALAVKLWKTEESVDAAMADASDLLAAVVQARKDHNVSVVATAKTTDTLARAIAQLAEAQKTVVAAHAEMEEVKLRLGVRTKMFGQQEKPSPNGGGVGTEDIREAV